MISIYKKYSNKYSKLFNSLIFIIFLMGLVYVLSPLFKKGFPVTDDGDWMIIRLSAFFQSFREGQFPVRFLGRLNYGYGYPVANFLYPGFMYLGSFIHVLGFSFVNSVKIIIILSVIGGSAAIYLWLRLFFDKVKSIIGAVLFLLSPYLLFDIYSRGSIGEVLALGVLPYCFYLIDKKKYKLLPFFIAALVVSHNSLAIIFILLISAYLIYKSQTKILLYILMGLGISSFFWLPALIEKSYVVFDTIKISDPTVYFAVGKHILLNSAIFIIAFIFLLIKARKKDKHPLNFFIISFGIMLFMSLPISYPIWKINYFSKLFQFPYRFLSIGLICGPFLVASFLSQTRRKYYFPAFLGILLIAFFQAKILFDKTEVTYKPDAFYATNPATTTVSDEYMPRWVINNPQKMWDNKIEVVSGAADITLIKFNSQLVLAEVEAYQDDTTIQINYIYYPGWGVMVDKEPSDINYDNDFGAMRVTLTPGKHQVYAAFRETPYRFIIDIVSFIFAVALLINLLWSLRQQKNQKK